MTQWSSTPLETTTTVANTLLNANLPGRSVWLHFFGVIQSPNLARWENTRGKGDRGETRERYRRTGSVFRNASGVGWGPVSIVWSLELPPSSKGPEGRKKQYDENRGIFCQRWKASDVDSDSLAVVIGVKSLNYFVGGLVYNWFKILTVLQVNELLF